MSPRQFEDKLLHKLREEIIQSKARMQDRLNQELEGERQKMKDTALNKQNEEIKQSNNQLRKQVTRLKQSVKK